MSRREELKAIRGVQPKKTTYADPSKIKREELKQIRQGQAALSTNVHLMERKIESLKHQKIETTKGARTATKNIESLQRMADRTALQASQQKSRIQNELRENKAFKQEVIANRNLYTPESYSKFLAEYSSYESDIKNTLGEYDKFLSSLKKTKGSGTETISDIEDWLAKRGELSRERQLARARLKREKLPQEYTVSWEEDGETKTATFKTPKQAENFIKRQRRRRELFTIRATGVPSITTTIWDVGPLKNAIIKLTTKSKEFFKKAGGHKEINLRSRGYQLSTKELMNRVGWAGTQVVVGAVRATPYILGGVAGFLVGGPGGVIFVPATMQGFTLPSVTTFEQKEKFEEYVKNHPEFWSEAILQGMGAIALSLGVSTGLSKAQQKIQQRQLNKFYEDFPMDSYEDWFVKEEIMAMYPELVDYQTIIEETIYMPKKTRILTDYQGDVATLIKEGYKKGLIYKLGDEYGIVISGHDAIPIYLPKGVGEPTVVFLPKDVTKIQTWLKHNPSMRIQLEKLSAEGIYVPAWLGITGPKIKIDVIEKTLKSLGFKQSEINKIMPYLQDYPDLTLNEIERLEPLKDTLDTMTKQKLSENLKTIIEVKPIVANIHDVKITPDQDVLEQTTQIQISIPEIEEPPPEEPPLEPRIPLIPLTKKEKEKLRKIRLQLYMGPKEKYRVKYTYPKGPGETLTVEARGFVDAVQKAQRARKSNRYLPSVVDVVRIR